MADARGKPSLAFVLVLLGGIFTLAGGAILSVIGSSLPGFLSGILGSSYGGGLLNVGLLGTEVISGILMIVAALLMHSSSFTRAKLGGVLAVVFSLVGLLGGGGLFIGFLLGFIGGILALWHKG